MSDLREDSLEEESRKSKTVEESTKPEHGSSSLQQSLQEHQDRPETGESSSEGSASETSEERGDLWDEAIEEAFRKYDEEQEQREKSQRSPDSPYEIQQEHLESHVTKSSSIGQAHGTSEEQDGLRDYAEKEAFRKYGEEHGPNSLHQRNQEHQDRPVTKVPSPEDYVPEASIERDDLLEEALEVAFSKYDEEKERDKSKQGSEAPQQHQEILMRSVSSEGSHTERKVRIPSSEGSGSCGEEVLPVHYKQPISRLVSLASTSSGDTSDGTKPLLKARSRQSRAWFDKISVKFSKDKDPQKRELQLVVEPPSSFSSASKESLEVPSASKVLPIPSNPDCVQQELDELSDEMERINSIIQEVSKSWEGTYCRVVRQHPIADVLIFKMTDSPFSIICQSEDLRNRLLKLKNCMKYTKKGFEKQREGAVGLSRYMIETLMLVDKEFDEISFYFSSVEERYFTLEIENLAIELNTASSVIGDLVNIVTQLMEKLEELTIPEEFFEGNTSEEDTEQSVSTDSFEEFYAKMREMKNVKPLQDTQDTHNSQALRRNEDSIAEIPSCGSSGENPEEHLTVIIKQSTASKTSPDSSSMQKNVQDTTDTLDSRDAHDSMRSRDRQEERTGSQVSQAAKRVQSSPDLKDLKETSCSRDSEVLKRDESSHGAEFTQRHKYSVDSQALEDKNSQDETQSFKTALGSLATQTSRRHLDPQAVHNVRSSQGFEDISLGEISEEDENGENIQDLGLQENEDIDFQEAQVELITEDNVQQHERTHPFRDMMNRNCGIQLPYRMWVSIVLCTLVILVTLIVVFTYMKSAL